MVVLSSSCQLLVILVVLAVLLIFIMRRSLNNTDVNERNSSENYEPVRGSALRAAILQSEPERCPPKEHLEMFATRKVDIIYDIAVVVPLSGNSHIKSVDSIKNTWGQYFANIEYIPSRVSIRPRLPRPARDIATSLKILAEKYPKSSWYFVANENAYINGPRLNELVKSFNPIEPHYIGHSTSIDGATNFCSGEVGYLISSALMKLILPSLLDISNSSDPELQLGILVAKLLKASNGMSICDSRPTFDFHGNTDTTSRQHFQILLTHCTVDGMSGSAFLQQTVGIYCESESQMKALWNLYGYFSPNNKDMGAIPSKPCPLGQKCVIAFSLFGSSPRYTVGALRNAMLRDAIYPRWVLRYYYDEKTVPPELINQLKLLGHELIPVAIRKKAGMYARFQIASDVSVDWFIVRDVDSRFNMREKHAVDEWMSSNYSIHILRDHPAHCRPINGGMWGGKKGAIPEMGDLIEKFAYAQEFVYGADQDFLSSVIYPKIIDNQIAHDSACCTSYKNSIPFPTRRIGAEHVGGVLTYDEAPRVASMKTLMASSWQAPLSCRRFPDWTKG